MFLFEGRDGNGQFHRLEIDGADTGEICKILSVAETNLRVILHRARMRLRRCLETHWFNRNRGEEP